MIAIASLLNPLPSPPLCESSSPSLTSSSLALYKHRLGVEGLQDLPMSKPSAMQVKASTNGHVRYKPCETQDEYIRAQHRKFSMHPVNTIKDHPRHIPYNSEKKTFQQRTGKDGVEAFYYTFRMPNEPAAKEPHMVMWDYNIGLVRITSFFKSLKHPKTMPAKVMSANPGLKDISHSITGGSISAQGYWVPFHAARAIATRFCWDIRYVLTPLFGIDFPASCIQPDEPLFLKLKIDREIINRCVETATCYRALSQQLTTAISAQRMPRAKQKRVRLSIAPKQDHESGYGADTERSLPKTPPSSPIGRLFPPVNTSTPKALHEVVSPAREPKPRKDHQTILAIQAPKTPYSRKRSLLTDKDDEEKPHRPEKIRRVGSAQQKSTRPPTPVKEARAAYALLELYKADSLLEEKQRKIGRRASY